MENAKGKSIDPKNREKLTNVIGLRNILKKILWEKEKAFDFFIDVYIIHKSGIKIFQKWTIDKCPKDIR